MSLKWSSARRVTVACTALVTSVALLAGCTKASNSNDDQTPAAEGTSITVVAPDAGLTWAFDNGFGSMELANNVQATLLKKPYVDSKTPGSQQQDLYSYDPYLAESYSVSDDKLTYTFVLRDAISQAGNHLTADDVLWSFQRKFNTSTSVSPTIMAPVITDPEQQIKIIDEHTVSFTLAEASYGAYFLALMCDLLTQVYDTKLLKEHTTPEDPWAVKWSTTNPNYGFGPYEVTDYEQGAQAVLTARSDFVLGEVPIKKVTYRIVGDEGTRANAVKNGDADLAENITPADSDALSSDPNVYVPRVDSPNNIVMMPLVTNKAPFDNVTVRQAMAYAIPYDDVVSNVFRGLATRQGSGILPSDAPGYDGSGLPDYTYDPAKAKQLLSDAGFPDGVKFTVTVSAADPATKETAVQVQTAAKAAGFDMTIDEVPAAEFDQIRSSHSAQALILRDYAITMTPGYQLGLFTAKGSGNNYADWENDDFYAALDAANSLPDAYSAEAGKAWNAAEKIYIEQSPIVFIARVQPSVVMSSKLTGFAWRSDNWIDFSNMKPAS